MLSFAVIYCHVLKAKESNSFHYWDYSSCLLLCRFHTWKMLHWALIVTGSRGSGLPTVWVLTWRKGNSAQVILLLLSHVYWRLPEIKLKHTAFYVNMFTSMSFIICIVKLVLCGCWLQCLPRLLRQKEKPIILSLYLNFWYFVIHGVLHCFNTALDCYLTPRLSFLAAP